MGSKIKTLITSFGMSGTVFHAPLIHAHPEFDFIGVVQRSGRSAKMVYPEVEVYESLTEALANASPDLVIVNTPPFLHELEALQALKADCHVLIEKPFALSLDSCQAIFDQAKASGKLVTAFQNRRWDSDFLTIKRMKAENLIGEWNYFESHFDRYRPEIDPGSWKERPHDGSGLVWNLGPHLLDQMVQLLGMPQWVKATVQKQRAKAEVDDFFSIQFKFDRCFAELKASYLVPNHELKYRIHGSHGTYIKHGMDVQESQLKAGLSPFDPAFGIEPPHHSGIVSYPDEDMEFVKQEKGDFTQFYSSLAESLTTGKPFPILQTEIENVVRILTAVYESSEKAKAIFF